MARIRMMIINRDGEFFAEPPIAVLTYNATAAQNDKLKIFNTTDEDLVVRLPSTNPFGTQPVLKVINAGDSFLWTVDSAATDGKYPFQVLMTKSGKKAKGNSDPVLIIDN